MTKRNSWNKIDWAVAREKFKAPFLYIARHMNRYSVTQDNPKYLSGKKKK